MREHGQFDGQDSRICESPGLGGVLWAHVGVEGSYKSPPVCPPSAPHRQITLQKHLAPQFPYWSFLLWESAWGNNRAKRRNRLPSNLNVTFSIYDIWNDLLILFPFSLSHSLKNSHVPNLQLYSQPLKAYWEITRPRNRPLVVMCHFSLTTSRSSAWCNWCPVLLIGSM